MKKITDHIEHIKGKPHHVRKRVAFATAAGISAFIGLVWFTGNLSAHSFAIAGSSFDQGVGQQPAVVKTSPSGELQGLAGAAAAVKDTKAPAHIEIVDTTPTVSAKEQSEQTVLPF